MGAGSSTRRVTHLPATSTIETRITEGPLHAEEHVETSVGLARGPAAPAAPVPPLEVHTLNPRQHLVDVPPRPSSHHRRSSTEAVGGSGIFGPLCGRAAPALGMAVPTTQEASRSERPSGSTDVPSSHTATFISAEGVRPRCGSGEMRKRQRELGVTAGANAAAEGEEAQNSRAELNEQSPGEKSHRRVSASGESLRKRDRLYRDEEEERNASAKASPSPTAPRGEDEEQAGEVVSSVPQVNTARRLYETIFPHAAAADHVRNTVAYQSNTRSPSPAPELAQYESLSLASIEQVLASKHSVYRVCLTGGPCAGKSTLLTAIQETIPKLTGFRVMCVPEAATLLVTGGMQWDSDLVVPQQLCLLRTQLALEDQFYALAVASGKPTVVVSDRGTMDGRAFSSEAQFDEILRGVGSTIDALRDRYDAVIHMVTAANGAENFYNLDNPARYEDLDGARASDLRLQQMYVGHPMIRLLNNSSSFEDKIERGLQVVREAVHKGQRTPPLPPYYLVRRSPAVLPVASATYTTYTTVLSRSQMSEIRLLVKREMSDGSVTHFFKSVRETSSTGPVRQRPSRPSPGSATAATSEGACGGAAFRSQLHAAMGNASAPLQQRAGCSQRISSHEYAALYLHRDSSRADVVMRATHFIYDGANCELTTLLSPGWAAGRQTLTIESCDASARERTPVGPRHRVSATTLHLPPFLEVDREVPVESLTTAYLISHAETGPLYTSLAFAPVFSRAAISAIGAHADTEDILNSTLSTSRGNSVLRAETSPLRGSPARLGADGRVDEESGATNGADNTRNATPNTTTLSAVKPEEDLLSETSQVDRRALAPLDLNQVESPPIPGKAFGSPTRTSPTPAHAPELPQGDSSRTQQQNHPASASRAAAGGEVETSDISKAPTFVSDGMRPHPEKTTARDPLALLPPIKAAKKNTVIRQTG